MLLVSDKWNTYTISNDRGDDWAALDLVSERLEQGFWYYNYEDGDRDHQYEDRAKAIVKAQDAHGAFSFLMERRDSEYEWVEVTQPRQLS